jgi:hypothetical protein
MSKNDDKILALKEQIRIKEEAVKGVPFIFKPKTNCVLFMDGIEFNINTLSLDYAKYLLCKLTVLADAYKKLGFDGDFILCQFKIDDWIDDVKSRIEIAKAKEETNKLSAYKKQLDKLLSEDKKTELLLAQMENDLK